MATYGMCDGYVRETARMLRQKFHPHLDEAGVTINYVFAYGARDKDGNVTSPAIMHGGYQCAAIVKVNNLLLRVQGLSDCTISIDGDTWNERPDDEKVAIIDHELEHIEVHEKHRKPKTTLKKHDFQIGGFKKVMDRHKHAAVETRQVVDAAIQMKQALTFDPTPIVERKLVNVPNIKFSDAVRQAVAEGLITGESAAAGVLRPAAPVRPVICTKCRIGLATRGALCEACYVERDIGDIVREAQQKTAPLQALADATVEAIRQEKAAAVMEQVAEQINAGAMDGPDVKVTATVSNAGEAGARTPRKRAPKQPATAPRLHEEDDDAREMRESLEWQQTAAQTSE